MPPPTKTELEVLEESFKALRERAEKFTGKNRSLLERSLHEGKAAIEDARRAQRELRAARSVAEKQAAQAKVDRGLSFAYTEEGRVKSLLEEKPQPVRAPRPTGPTSEEAMERELDRHTKILSDIAEVDAAIEDRIAEALTEKERIALTAAQQLTEQARAEVEAGRLLVAERFTFTAAQQVATAAGAPIERAAVREVEQLTGDQLRGELTDALLATKAQYQIELKAGNDEAAARLLARQAQLEEAILDSYSYARRHGARALRWVIRHPIATAASTVGLGFSIYLGKLTTFPGFYLEETAQQNGANLWGNLSKETLERVMNLDMGDEEVGNWVISNWELLTMMESTAKKQHLFNESIWAKVAPPTRDALKQWEASTWHKLQVNKDIMAQALLIRGEAKAGRATGPYKYKIGQINDQAKSFNWSVSNYKELIENHIGLRDWGSAEHYLSQMRELQTAARSFMEDPRNYATTITGRESLITSDHWAQLALNDARIESLGKRLAMRDKPLPEEEAPAGESPAVGATPEEDSRAKLREIERRMQEGK